jgi:hypothetical protein
VKLDLPEKKIKIKNEKKLEDVVVVVWWWKNEE